MSTATNEQPDRPGRRRRRAGWLTWGFAGTIASIVAGALIAGLTVVGLVNATVDSGPPSGGAQGDASIAYGAR